LNSFHVIAADNDMLVQCATPLEFVHPHVVSTTGSVTYPLHNILSELSTVLASRFINLLSRARNSPGQKNYIVAEGAVKDGADFSNGRLGTSAKLRGLAYATESSRSTREYIFDIVSFLFAKRGVNVLEFAFMVE
jgi:hypothetical protein